MNITTEIKRKFYDSLKRGTGEAYLIAKKYSTIDFSNYIIRGALNNFAYDGQSEDNRARYIFDLIAISNNQIKIQEAILGGLAKEREDTWSLTHLFALAKLYAEKGNDKFRQAIYDRFLNNPIEGSDWVGYQEILELDGLNGLIYICEKFGKVIARNPDEWQDNSIVKHFQDDNPQMAVLEELKNRAKSNKYIQLYLDNIESSEERRRKNRPKPPIFDNIIDEILNSKSFLLFRRRRELRETELSEIGERLLIEEETANIEKFLFVFSYHKFPFDSNFILKLAKQKSNSQNSIKEYATYALKYLKSDSIRAFALDRISSTRNPAKYTDILISNYKDGDYELLARVAKKFKNEDIIESLAISYTDIFSSNITKECKEPLEILYSKMNCGIHRMVIVEILIKSNVLPDRIKEEIEFDSYLETRELIRKTVGNKN